MPFVFRVTGLAALRSINPAALRLVECVENDRGVVPLNLTASRSADGSWSRWERRFIFILCIYAALYFIFTKRSPPPSPRAFFFFFPPDMFLFFNHNTAGNPDASYFSVIQLLDNVIRREINKLAPAKAERFWKTDYRPQICSPHLSKKRKKGKTKSPFFTVLHFRSRNQTRKQTRGKKESVEQK